MVRGGLGMMTVDVRRCCGFVWLLFHCSALKTLTVQCVPAAEAVERRAETAATKVKVNFILWFM